VIVRRIRPETGRIPLTITGDLPDDDHWRPA
jgi:hypothetical protein